MDFLGCCQGGHDELNAWVCSSPPTEDERQGSHLRGQIQAPSSSRHAGVPKSVAGDDKETAKQRLQRMIREFAHDVVGVGLPVEADYQCLPHGHDDAPHEVTLRMDRRLTRIELWPPEESVAPGMVPLAQLELQEVASIVKGFSSSKAEDDRQDRSKEACTLSLVRRGGMPMRLVFETNVVRDRAYTCLRIFQMSVDQQELADGSKPEVG